MKLQDLLDLLDLDLLVTRYANQKGRFSASFRNTDVKEGIMLCGAYGDGKDYHSAVEDYLKKIRGRRIVINAGDKERRREFTVPESVEQ